MARAKHSSDSDPGAKFGGFKNVFEFALLRSFDVARDLLGARNFLEVVMSYGS